MSGSKENGLVYAAPVEVRSRDDCTFYHTMEVPGHGLIVGPWDLRPGLRAYLGNVQYRGKRVLEIGTADGYLTFELERMGAEVVSYDLSEHDRWDVVPYARRADHMPLAPSSQAPEEAVASPLAPSWVTDADEAFRGTMRRVNNAYWLCHRAFGSTAQLVHGDVYSVPTEIGPFDIAVFGAILLHTRDPLAAVTRAARMTRETIVVTDALGWFTMPAPLRALRSLLPRQLRRPVARFMPDWRTSTGPDGWWRLSPEIVQEFLGVVGFERSVVTTHVQQYNGRRRRLFTVVAHRTVPMPSAPPP